MALVGMSNTLALEGAKYNIHCNVIVPTAASRLTKGMFPEGRINIILNCKQIYDPIFQK